jgi:hypothetical protein
MRNMETREAETAEEVLDNQLNGDDNHDSEGNLIGEQYESAEEGPTDFDEYAFEEEQSSEDEQIQLRAMRRVRVISDKPIEVVSGDELDNVEDQLVQLRNAVRILTVNCVRERVGGPDSGYALPRRDNIIPYQEIDRMEHDDDIGLVHRLSEIVYLLLRENKGLRNDIEQIWHDFGDEFNNQIAASVAASQVEQQVREDVWQQHSREVSEAQDDHNSITDNDSDSDEIPDLQDVSDSEEEDDYRGPASTARPTNYMNEEDAEHVEHYVDDIVYSFTRGHSGDQSPEEDGVMYDWWETYDGGDEPDPESSYGMRIQHDPDETLYVIGELQGQRAAMRVTGQAKARPEMPSRCVTISGTINGLKATILLDSGSSINAMSPSYATVGDISAFPLDKPVGLQLGCVGSRSKINFGTQQTLTIGDRQFPTYFNIVNLDHYDIVLGIPFMKMNQVIMDFTRNVIRCGTDLVPALEGEVATPRAKTKAKDHVRKHNTPKQE